MLRRESVLKQPGAAPDVGIGVGVGISELSLCVTSMVDGHIVG